MDAFTDCSCTSLVNMSVSVLIRCFVSYNGHYEVGTHGKLSLEILVPQAGRTGALTNHSTKCPKDVLKKSHNCVQNV